MQGLTRVGQDSQAFARVFIEAEESQASKETPDTFKAPRARKDLWLSSVWRTYNSLAKKSPWFLRLDTHHPARFINAKELVSTVIALAAC